MSLADELLADLLELEDTQTSNARDVTSSTSDVQLGNGPSEHQANVSEKVYDIRTKLKTSSDASQLKQLLVMIQDKDAYSTTPTENLQKNEVTSESITMADNDASDSEGMSDSSFSDDDMAVGGFSVPDSTDSAEYQMMVKANTANLEIEHDLQVIYRFVLDLYGPTFPELSELLKRPLDYLSVVRTIGAHPTTASITSLHQFMPATIVTSISMAHAMSAGIPLSNTIWSHVQQACDIALYLDKSRGRILDEIASRVAHLAPNVTALLGSVVAAKLVAGAGGLHALLKIPACNLQVLGHAKRRDLHGFAATESYAEGGTLMQCDLVASAPSELRAKALRMVAARCTLAARVDALGGGLSVGLQFKNEIAQKLDKLQEPPAPKAPKALPAPEMTQKARRGGRRIRKMKEKYTMSTLREQQNRLAFGVAEKEGGYSNGATRGLGMMNETGSGRIRAAKAQDRTRISKRVTLPSASTASGIQTVFGGHSGVASSIVLTQGIQLSNPANAIQQQQQQSSTKSNLSRFFQPNMAFDRVKKTDMMPPPSAPIKKSG